MCSKHTAQKFESAQVHQLFQMQRPFSQSSRPDFDNELRATENAWVHGAEQFEESEVEVLIDMQSQPQFLLLVVEHVRGSEAILTVAR